MLLFVLSCIFVSIPYLVVTIVPSTDLAQHVAQIRLFVDHWHHPDDGYRIQLNSPYSLGYLVVGLWYSKAAGYMSLGSYLPALAA